MSMNWLDLWFAAVSSCSSLSVPLLMGYCRCDGARMSSKASVPCPLSVCGVRLSFLPIPEKASVLLGSHCLPWYLSHRYFVVFVSWPIELSCRDARWQ